MNMHGFIAPVQDAPPGKPPLARRALDWLNDHRPFLIFVVLPMLVLATYYYLIAADQYKTEAHYTVESAAGGGAGSTSSVGDILGITGMLTPAQAQATALADYMDSQEALNAIQSKIDLRQIYRRPEADFLTKLRKANPTPEELLDYYKGMVRVRVNKDTGISVLEVRSFRPGDSFKLARDLLLLGERRVNELNSRSYADAIASARVQFEQTDRMRTEVERQLTAFRQLHRDINPVTSGSAQTTLMSAMSGNISMARAQLDQMSKTLSPKSPQYIAMSEHVRSLESEFARQSGEAAGGDGTIASRLGGYEDLTDRQQFAQKQYEAAAANLDKAIEQARRQSLYLVRVVEPTMPIEAEYPHRRRILGTALVLLLLAYSIGWLIVAGVREHSL